MNDQATGKDSPLRFALSAAAVVTVVYQFGASALMLALGDRPFTLLVLGLSQFVLMLLPTLWLARYQELSLRELLRLRGTTLGIIGATIVGMLALWPLLQGYLWFQEVVLVPQSLLERYHEFQQSYQQAIGGLLGGTGALAIVSSFVTGAFAPAICEEMLFRGMVQRTLERVMRPWVAVLVGGAIFGAVHLNPIDFVVLSALGAFLGYVAWSSRSILPAVAGHFLFNAANIVALIAAGPHARTEDVSAIDFGNPFGIATLGVSLALFVFVIRWIAQQRTPVPPQAVPPQAVPPSSGTAAIGASGGEDDPVDLSEADVPRPDADSPAEPD